MSKQKKTETLKPSKTETLKPSKTEIKFQNIKLISGGGQGLELNYSFMFSNQGRICHKKNKTTNDTPPHDDLIKLIKSMKYEVAKIESLDYGREIVSFNGFEPTDMQLKIAEGVVASKMESIEATGIAIVEKGKSTGVIISYKKGDKNDNVKGHVTNWINLSEFHYDVEEELKEKVDKIIDEAYQYEYEEKYSDVEQQTIKHEFEEAEIVKDDESES